MNEKEVERKLELWSNQMTWLGRALNEMDERLKKVERIFDGFIKSLKKD